MGVLVDTAALASFERSVIGSGNAVALLPQDGFLSAVSLAEMAVGVELADTLLRRTQRLAFLQFVRDRLEVIPFGEGEASEYARLYAHLRRNGRMIGQLDLLIAATALANGHEVMTANVAEFSRVPGLAVRPVPPR